MRNYLLDFEPVIEKKYFKWDQEHGIKTISKHKSSIIENDKLRIIEYFQDLFNSEIGGNLNNLRDGIIHGDANDNNLILQNPINSDQEVIWGLIDFGDFIYSRQIYDLTITIAYALLGKENPISTIIDIVRIVLPLLTNSCNTSRSFLTSCWCNPVVGSSNKIRVLPVTCLLSSLDNLIL